MEGEQSSCDHKVTSIRKKAKSGWVNDKERELLMECWSPWPGLGLPALGVSLPEKNKARPVWGSDWRRTSVTYSRVQFLSHATHALQMSRAKESKTYSQNESMKVPRPLPKFLSCLIFGYQLTLREFNSRRMWRQSSKDHVTSSPGQRIRPGV